MRGDQRSHIYVSCSDNAIKRRHDLLVALQHNQAPQVVAIGLHRVLRCAHVRFRDTKIRFLRIPFLLRKHAFSDENFISLPVQ